MMTEQRHTVELDGCTPVPLAHYLKALGVLRLVAEQVDPIARGWWNGDTFVLTSNLDRNGLLDFFLNEYSPTPLVGPWGARSGFFAAPSEKSARAALDQIVGNQESRLNPFRSAIAKTQDVLQTLGLQEKADNDDDKLRLLQACRAMLDDSLLQWLDAVYVLLNDNRAFPPLLGTGGNERSGSYMSGFAQQVVSVLIERKWDHAIASSLFGENLANTSDKQTPGHFAPDAAGGPNAAAGFEGGVGMNPWDYLLTLEGTLLFAASAVKRLEDHSDGTLAYPFCVRPTGVGYASADLSDEGPARAEMWFPLWNTPATVSEIETLLSEGRATVNAKRVKNGTDFVRAVATLGIDRGIEGFERYGFQQRNGLSYFAVHLGRFHVRGDVSHMASLINEIDGWLDRFRRAASGKNASARSGRALRRLESAIFDLCRRGQPEDVQAVLVALGDAEAAVAVSRQLRESVAPIPLLDREWLAKSNDHWTEFRLAAALASIHHSKVGPLRRHLEPIDPKSWTAPFPKWAKEADDPAIVWGGGDLVRNLNAVLKRRMVQILQLGKDQADSELFMPLKGRCVASLGDVADFIEGNVDDQRIESLLRGLMLLDWQSKQALRGLREPNPTAEPMPTAAYALLKLCHLPEKLGTTAIKLSPQILQRAIAGDGPTATQLAARRLRASGYPPAVETVPVPGAQMRRIAAALVFPISSQSTERLRDSVLRLDAFPSEDNGNDPEPEPVTATGV